MREIKFRIWHKKTGTMIYLLNMGIEEEYSSLSFYAKEETEYSGIGRLPSYYGRLQEGDTIEQYEVMQFTGLKDNNGKEIYEGDILRNEERWTREDGQLTDVKVHIAVVEWFDYVIGGSLARNVIDHEVIGNIYENPDLLKQS